MWAAQPPHDGCQHGQGDSGELLSPEESKAERPYFRTWLCLGTGGKTLAPGSNMFEPRTAEDLKNGEFTFTSQGVYLNMRGKLPVQQNWWSQPETCLELESLPFGFLNCTRRFLSSACLFKTDSSELI